MIKKIVVIFVVVLFFGVAFYIIRFATNNPYGKRIEMTKFSLAYLRGHIKDYHQNTGRFPSSLLEMKQYYEKKGEDSFRKENKEYISSTEGSDKEYESINGMGGWYYNKETGSLAVNIDKSLKKCFKSYYYLGRNQKPSEW